MRTRLFVLIAVVILVLVLALLPAQAQDSGMIVCDSTLITLLYIAEHDYGFQPMMDVAQFDKGQFAPLFDAMMAEMMEATPEAMMGEATPEMMMTEETMMEGMTQLQPGAVEGENEACTQLRAEVEGFLYETLKSKMMMN